VLENRGIGAYSVGEASLEAGGGGALRAGEEKQGQRERGHV
jgi:hypothetical protein